MTSHASTAHSKPASQPSAHAPPDDGSQAPSSSEQLWAQRAKTLANEKDRKLSSQQQQKSKMGSRKNSRGSQQLNNGQSKVVPQTQQQVPAPLQQIPANTYQQQPVANNYYGQAPVSGNQAPVGGYQAPAGGYQAPAGGYQPGITQPINHTVYTDEGQRVSVDINLKMVNAHDQPGQAGAAPAYHLQQAPASQGQYSHAQQQQPGYAVGELTHQNISAQYGQRQVRGGGAPEGMQLQSVTSSASSAGYGQNQLRRQQQQQQLQPAQPQPHPATQQHFHPAHAPPPPQPYGLPRQPEGASHVHPAAPSQDPRFALQQPRVTQPIKQGFTKHSGSKPPPAQPRHAFQQHQQYNQQVSVSVSCATSR